MTSNPSEKGRYHHGDLRDALVAAADEILLEAGVEAFSLREAARRASVSPAAPAHHFGSVAGLLTEVAIRGFEELTRFLREGEKQGGADPYQRLRGQGMGYVRFALAHPGRFNLMFRKDRLEADNPKLRAAGGAAYAELERVMRDNLGPKASPESVAFAAQGAWALVHGFAHLALDGKFGAAKGGAGAAVDEVLPKILAMYLPKAIE
jgi:AcrR family transcriptional regulator